MANPWEVVNSSSPVDPTLAKGQYYSTASGNPLPKATDETIRIEMKFYDSSASTSSAGSRAVLPGDQKFTKLFHMPVYYPRSIQDGALIKACAKHLYKNTRDYTSYLEDGNPPNMVKIWDLVKREGYGNAKVWFGRWCVKKEDEWCEESVWITFKIN